MHAAMCGNWWYKKLYEMSEKRAIDELLHETSLLR
jgi:bacterioferritin (cytochrome b1)